MFRWVRKILLQESGPEVRLVYLLLTGLHLLLHSRPRVLCISHQQENGKCQLLRLSTCQHPKYFLTFFEPSLGLIRGSLFAELWWLMFQDIFHGHHSSGLALGCAATGCMASTIWWIACAISSAPVSLLLLLLAIAWMRHILTGKSNHLYFNFITKQNNTYIRHALGSLPKNPMKSLKSRLYYQV